MRQTPPARTFGHQDASLCDRSYLRRGNRPVPKRLRPADDSVRARIVPRRWREAARAGFFPTSLGEDLGCAAIESQEIGFHGISLGAGGATRFA
jgi:hypothetical protein